jgi:lysophospholipase
MVAALARVLNLGAPSQAFVWGMAKRDHRSLPFSLQIVTSDPVRYERSRRFLVAHPQLGLNGPTWGWLAAALKSILQLHAPGYAEAIVTPALLLAAGRDRVCNSQALCAFAARMPHALCLTIAGAEHEILMERDIYRDQVWAAFDRFMDTQMPRP